MKENETGSGKHPYPEALYYHIAQDALEASRKETAQDDKSEFQRKQAVATAIVFSALCLEAFINQEYEEHPETSGILKDNDRTSLTRKWSKLPLLLGAKETFDKGKTPFHMFAKLVRVRNQRLVHFKPKKETRCYPERKPRKDPYFGDLVGDVKLAEKYVNCVGEMIHELHHLTSSKTRVPPFLSGSKYTSKVWASMTCSFESSQGE